MQITFSSVSEGELNSKIIGEIRDLNELCKQNNYWVDMEGYDPETLKTIVQIFPLNPLTVEDLENVTDRIKIDEFPDYIYSVSKGVVAQGDNFVFKRDEIYMVLSENNVITFHKEKSEIVNHCMNSMRNRMKSVSKNIPLNSLVLQSIYDFSVDSFFSVLSNIEQWISSMSGQATDFDSIKSSDIKGVRNLMFLIARARREMGELRIMLSQHRDVMALAERGTIKYISVDLMPAFRDVYDHTFQLIETLDSYMMRTSDLRDLYFTMRAAFTDNILRLLTIVATIFLPLTFLTGFYGMNFTEGFYEPGSATIYGFYTMVAVMLTIAGTLLIVFRKKGWV